jgi:hypothetical protein
MSNTYWRIVPIDFERGEGSRRVFLYGELDELVGPMSMEMAEAWIKRFDKAPSDPPDEAAQASLPRPYRRVAKEIPTKSSARKNDNQRRLVGNAK